MMTNDININGYAAECLVTSVINNLGFRYDLGLKKHQVLEELYAVERGALGKHFTGALAGVEEDYGLSDAPVNVIVDYALGVDVTFESEDGECISLDVTINPNKVGKKLRVSEMCMPIKHKLGYEGHLVVLVDSVKGYAALSDDEMWYIIDSINAAINAGDRVVEITIS